MTVVTPRSWSLWTWVASFTWFALASSLSAQTANLVRDINLDSDLRADSHPSSLATIGDRVIFTAIANTAGRQLWGSDGTAEGTQVLFDGSTDPIQSSGLDLLGRLGNRLILSVDHSPFEESLWVTDSTPEGTTKLAGTGTQVELSSSYFGSQPALMADRVLFIGTTESTGTEVWVTNGTPEGTQLLVDTAPGAKSGFSWELAATEQRGWFLSSSQYGERTLWLSDGTTAGTTEVLHWTSGTSVRSLAALGDLAIFQVQASDQELWVSDGTAAGTMPITDFAAVNPLRIDSGIQVLGARAFFVVDDVTHGEEIWMSDGTRQGTPARERWHS